MMVCFPRVVTLALETIRTAARAGRIRWRYHALLRARQRRITRDQAKRVIEEGCIVEQYRKAKPFPKCLMMAEVEPGRPLYLSLAYDQSSDYLHIITVHWFDPRKWKNPGTRKAQKP